jgi:2'-5' RNA ligase
MSSRPEQGRLFFALVPPPGVLDAVVAIQQVLKIEARAVVRENLHITLAFLGDVPWSRLAELRSIASDTPMPACTLRLERVGGFPRSGVAFLAPAESPPELDDFRKMLTGRLARAGFAADDKPWRPHLTLYRKLRKSCSRMAVKPVDWPLREFALVSSTLRNSGPVYRVLDRWQSVD